MPATLREQGTTPTKVHAAGAMRTVVSVFGVVIALAGIEHGIGEVLQGSVRPGRLVIESWHNTDAFDVLGGEPALTIVPNLLVTGILAVVAAVAVAATPARRGRILELLGRGWRWMLAIGLGGFLGLLPGTIVLSEWFGLRSDALVYTLGAVAFGGLVLALLSAAAHDRSMTAPAHD